ncbi:hypothetical protein HRR76_005901 [Exophiala dermatitidis]|nr:hypothetical protein HRR73_004037 [Exophiala dermatitidis]KAJ4533952.1 hypothetical protein HRR76_005901 [Exophiala dermatitidis]
MSFLIWQNSLWAFITGPSLESGHCPPHPTPSCASFFPSYYGIRGGTTIRHESAFFKQTIMKSCPRELRWFLNCRASFTSKDYPTGGIATYTPREPRNSRKRKIARPAFSYGCLAAVEDNMPVHVFLFYLPMPTGDISLPVLEPLKSWPAVMKERDKILR